MSENRLLPILHIEAKPHTGTPRIVNKGVTVQFLASFINHPEWSIERICEEFSLIPAEVYAAWSYYYDHKQEIDALIQEDREESEKFRANPDYQKQVEALKKRHREKSSSS